MALAPIIKELALAAMDSSAPTKVVFGKVTKAKPLEIYIESKLTIKEEDGQIKLTRQVTDYQTEVTPINWLTENKLGGTGDDSFASHNHGIVGRKKIIIHNSLKIGDMVILLRMQGGQVFIVLDKIGEAGTGSNEGTGGSSGGSTGGGSDGTGGSGSTGGGEGGTSTYEVYDGSYSVTSSASEQTLNTKNKVMLEDLTINGMPVEESENDGGGTTVTIG